MIHQETHKSFNEEFCTHLEYHLGQAFNNSDRHELRGLWCDGIAPDGLYNQQGMILTTAWVGKDGQGEYEMTIHLGNQALKNYSEGADMIDCLPSSDSMDWIDIDTEKKKIEIKLN